MLTLWFKSGGLFKHPVMPLEVNYITFTDSVHQGAQSVYLLEVWGGTSGENNPISPLYLWIHACSVHARFNLTNITLYVPDEKRHFIHYNWRNNAICAHPVHLKGNITFNIRMKCSVFTTRWSYFATLVLVHLLCKNNYVVAYLTRDYILHYYCFRKIGRLIINFKYEKYAIELTQAGKQGTPSFPLLSVCPTGVIIEIWDGCTTTVLAGAWKTH